MYPSVHDISALVCQYSFMSTSVQVGLSSDHNRMLIESKHWTAMRLFKFQRLCDSLFAYSLSLVPLRCEFLGCDPRLSFGFANLLRWDSPWDISLSQVFRRRNAIASPFRLLPPAHRSPIVQCLSTVSANRNDECCCVVPKPAR